MINSNTNAYGIVMGFVPIIDYIFVQSYNPKHTKIWRVLRNIFYDFG